MLGKTDVESVEGTEAHAMPLKGSSMIRCPEEVSIQRELFLTPLVYMEWPKHRVPSPPYFKISLYKQTLLFPQITFSPLKCEMWLHLRHLKWVLFSFYFTAFCHVSLRWELWQSIDRWAMVEKKHWTSITHVQALKLSWGNFREKRKIL